MTPASTPSKSEYTAIQLNDNSDANSFKEAILAILSAYEFVVDFEEAYSFNKLASGIKAYSADNTNRGTGGVTYVRNGLKDIKDGKIRLEELLKCYNKLSDPVLPAQWLDIANYLGYTPPKHLDPQLALDHINSLAYCRYLFEHKWPAIHAIKWSFSNEANLTSPTIIDFVASGQPLKRCLIELVGNILLPRQTQTPSFTGATSEQVNSGIYTERIEFAGAHYLNGSRQAIVAQLTFTWHDYQGSNGIESILHGVRLKQQEGFFDQRSATTYVQAEGGIYNAPNGTLFVTLRAEAKIPAAMQMTFSKQLTDDLRFGTFSALLPRKRENQPDETMSISGVVIIKTVLALPPDKEKLPTDPALTYRLANQILMTSMEQGNEMQLAWKGLQPHVGRYICYYMRLSKSPARFELSQIDLYPDGSAQLTQPQTDQPPQTFNGSVRLINNRLWLYFGYLPALGREAIRFIVERNDSNEGGQFRGVFSSQTITEKRLVAGRMLMKKWPDDETVPDKSIPHEQLFYSDFEQPDDLSFFTEPLSEYPNLTDGPIWADVARRLHKHSALSTIDRLCQPEAINDEPIEKHTNEIDTPASDLRLQPYPNGRFYYYTFKQEVNRDPFLIERNIVTFHRNGKVSIEATENTYEGYSYYLNNTLRLSATNIQQGGFLEAFFELPYDRPNLASTKILYGLSLWRSGIRLQGKAVVLSRIGMTDSAKKTEVFQFYDPISKPSDFAREKKRMHDENVNGEGIISYLRGDLNRFSYASTNALPEQFRPRDQQSRELHYRAACYCGFEIPRTRTNHERRDWFKSAQYHLRQAYAHGYACQFADLVLDPKKASEDLDYVELNYSDRFPNADLNIDGTADILKRIQDIAREQIQLKTDIGSHGPLGYPDLQKLVRLLWDELFIDSAAMAVYQ